MRATRHAATPKWKQVSVRVRGEVWQQIATAAAAFGKNQAAIVTEAMAAYYAQLSPRERHAIAEMVAVRTKAAGPPRA